MSAWVRVLAWLLLAGLIFVTLAPISFRPVSALPVQLERALALSVIGFVFALAYPRHVILVALLVLGATVATELLQLFAPSRHGRIADVLAKLVGGGGGLVAGHLLTGLVARIKHSDR